MLAIKDHYINALQYAESKSEFTLQELVAELDLDQTQEMQFALQIHEKQIFQQNATDYINRYKDEGIKLHLSVEDKFRLLNYVALEEARYSSRSATYYAIAALIVSIVASITNVCLSLKQIKSEINIPIGFIGKINEISEKQTQTNNALSGIESTLLKDKHNAQKK